MSATDRRFGFFFYSPKVLGQSSRGPNLMFVVIQFPVADGRAFASGSGVVERPDWGAPKISPLLAHRDFVRGFGRLAYRPKETSAAWVDEDFFAYAKRAVQFPTLQQRHFEGQGSGRWMVKRSSRWMVSCRFRRLFCDGEAAVRLEIGFAVTPDYERGKVSPDEVVRQLLRLPAVVPGGWSGNATKDLMLLGPYIARRYAQASTRHGWNVAATLVTAGDPIVVVESSGWERERTPPGEAINVSIAPQRRGYLHLATTRTPHGGIKTWYLHHDAWRDVLAYLRQYVQGETLDPYRDAWRDVRLGTPRTEGPQGARGPTVAARAWGGCSRGPQAGAELRRSPPRGGMAAAFLKPAVRVALREIGPVFAGAVWVEPAENVAREAKVRPRRHGTERRQGVRGVVVAETNGAAHRVLADGLPVAVTQMLADVHET